jgi:type II secretory pathway pseudopilin PulG
MSKRKTTRNRSKRSEGGFSVVEMLAVVAIVVIIGAIALPQMVSSRRMLRSVALSRTIMSQLRWARQQAMATEQAFTFSYNTNTRVIRIIDHGDGAMGAGVIANVNYPNNGTVVRTIPLDGDGLAAADIMYGPPPSAPVAARTLGDLSTYTPPNAGTNLVNITFQPNGSVIDSTGQPANFALFIYNARVADDTARAVSVLGLGGRVKIWRYDTSVLRYVE